LPALPGAERSPRPEIAPGRKWWSSALNEPEALVRWAFYLSVFSIPFTRLYVPGTGDRLGAIRIVQMLLMGAVALQPRICLRFLPAALLWFAAYCVLRICSGLWLTPGLRDAWWPSTFEWFQYSLPWLWMAFNLLQFPRLRRGGLWAFVWASSLCASLHIVGVGVSTVDDSVDEVRTSVFGENANVVGATYAMALIILIGLAMANNVRLNQRLLLFPLIALVGIGMAKTGSRTAILLVFTGVLVLLFQAERFSSRSRRYATLILIGVLLAGAVWQIPTVMDRFRDIDPHNVGRENPRARMAPVLCEMILRSPIYGSGPDQYQYELTRRAMPYLIQEQKTIVAHNLALLLLVETGIIGFLIFATGLGKAVTAAWRARFQPSGLLPLALLLPFVLSGLTVNNPTGDHAFWFAVAYALSGQA